jgi:methylmalonyl-CoA mutase
VEAELKGAPFDKKMFTATYEGLTLKPIYCRADVANLPHVNSLPGFAPFVRGTSASGYVKESWDVSQEISVASPSEFNHAARNSISRGLNALNMVLDRATRNGFDPDWAMAEDVGFAAACPSRPSTIWAARWRAWRLDQTSLFVRSGASALPFAALLSGVWRKSGRPG